MHTDGKSRKQNVVMTRRARQFAPLSRHELTSTATITALAAPFHSDGSRLFGSPIAPQDAGAPGKPRARSAPGNGRKGCPVGAGNQDQFPANRGRSRGSLSLAVRITPQHPTPSLRLAVRLHPACFPLGSLSGPSCSTASPRGACRALPPARRTPAAPVRPVPRRGLVKVQSRQSPQSRRAWE